MAGPDHGAPSAAPALTPGAVASVGGLAEPRWSPDGGRLAWVRGDAGGAALVVDGVAVPGVAPAGLRGGAWTWAGTGRIVVAGEGALTVVATPGRGRPGSPGAAATVAARGRTAAPAAGATGLVAFVDETDDSCVVAVAPLDGSSPPRIVSRADFAWDPAWSPDGRLLAWHEWDVPAMPWDASRIVVAAPDGADRVVVAGGPAEGVGQPRFAPCGPSRLAFVSDRDGWLNVAVTDPDTAARGPIAAEAHEHATPAWGPGQRSFAWSPDGSYLAWCRNEDGFGRLVWSAVDAPDAVAAPDAAPTPRVVEWSKGWHHGLDWSAAGLACVRSGARTPPTLVVLGREPPVRREVDVAPGAGALPLDGFVEPEPVTWTGLDGAPVAGLLCSLHGGGARPLLVSLHGGPTDQACVEWSPRVQHWVRQGWAVLAPNPRGSTGHGRAYTQALRGGWGALDVDDVVAGIRTAAARGWGDPARLGLVGGSAGGLLALLVALRIPDDVGAVVASYPVTDLGALAAETHRFERHYTGTLVGTGPDAAARLRERSPIHHAAALRVPALVLQGDADPVVPRGQVVAFVDRVRGAGGHVELHTYAGEGHGWKRPETVADALRRTDAFLARWVLDP